MSISVVISIYFYLLIKITITLIAGLVLLSPVVLMHCSAADALRIASLELLLY
jgi:hypothetical protein